MVCNKKAMNELTNQSFNHSLINSITQMVTQQKTNVGLRLGKSRIFEILESKRKTKRTLDICLHIR